VVLPRIGRKGTIGWFTLTEKSSRYGVDGLKPKDGNLITFKYENKQHKRNISKAMQMEQN
jgi:hypothetical protein